MLLCQNLRGSHDAGLIAVVNGDEHRHQGHQRLAASYIALQQAVHLSTATHIFAYFTDYALLGFCQREWQVVMEEGVEHFAYMAEHIAAILAALVAGVP